MKYYEKRMHIVCDYIYKHLNEELTVDALCNVAGFSKYHFHRQFSNYMGMGVFKFVQQLRLKRASYELVFYTDKRIIDIAMDAQFDHPESFSRAFKKVFLQSPMAFRRQPDWLQWHREYRVVENRMALNLDVKLVNFVGTQVAAFEHRGPVERMLESSATFRGWRQRTGISPIGTSRTFGIIYDNPECVPAEDFRFDIAGEVHQAIGDNQEGVVNKFLAGGRCAVVRHYGTHENMGDVVCALYDAWLPNSNEELRDAPCFFHWHNFFPHVAEHELITDIYLPLK
ncbi:AraC family transcriptional regulator [Marinomonas primoryensis]|uniref:AraC family transcriptional regulator n=1 Tax=Marinomonas primoryensis TaxID=178399 RepID=A0A2Z4PXD0_9GAMM|nr:AraC family transcriptional regulator [Marinomonas primoryensis]AWY02291.1 AraC family transcriptional regulator [Marinomonas primoryensis]